MVLMPVAFSSAVAVASVVAGGVVVFEGDVVVFDIVGG